MNCNFDEFLNPSLGALCLLGSTWAAEVCEPTKELEDMMKNECPDKSLLDDLAHWQSHAGGGHSTMGKCLCGEEGTKPEDRAEKGNAYTD